MATVCGYMKSSRLQSPLLKCVNQWWSHMSLRVNVLFWSTVHSKGRPLVMCITDITAVVHYSAQVFLPYGRSPLDFCKHGMHNPFTQWKISNYACSWWLTINNCHLKSVNRWIDKIQAVNSKLIKVNTLTGSLINCKCPTILPRAYCWNIRKQLRKQKQFINLTSFWRSILTPGCFSILLTYLLTSS